MVAFTQPAMYTSPLMQRAANGRQGLLALLFTTFAVANLGCDVVGSRGRDASAPLSQRVAEVSVRIDAPPSGTPSVSVLAFRASVTGLLAGEVLGVVDPLVARAPEKGCEIRDVAAAARALPDQGGQVELEELTSVSLNLGAGMPPLRPTPRVYPQLAAAVGGVIGEAGPVDLAVLPEKITVLLAGQESDGPVGLTLQQVPRLLDQAGDSLANVKHLDPTVDLALTVSGPARSFLEIRPLFGASTAIACPAGPNGRVVVPHALLEQVAASSGRVPVTFEAVWRDNRDALLGGQTVRLSIETRSAAVLDLRPAGSEQKPQSPPPSAQ
jgi:hypothetical protein